VSLFLIASCFVAFEFLYVGKNLGMVEVVTFVTHTDSAFICAQKDSKGLYIKSLNTLHTVR
jgi:hypothetical protein